MQQNSWFRNIYKYFSILSLPLFLSPSSAALFFGCCDIYKSECATSHDHLKPFLPYIYRINMLFNQYDFSLSLSLSLLLYFFSNSIILDWDASGSSIFRSTYFNIKPTIPYIFKSNEYYIWNFHGGKVNGII